LALYKSLTYLLTYLLKYYIPIFAIVNFYLRRINEYASTNEKGRFLTSLQILKTANVIFETISLFVAKKIFSVDGENLIKIASTFSIASVVFLYKPHIW